jgi:hypothetical protein
MKMVFEDLVPGVKHRDNSNSSTQAAFTKLQQRFADRLEQKTQNGFLMRENQAVKFMGQGENQVKVSHGQKLGGLFFQPSGFSQRLTLRAVAVAAGVVSRALKAARIAAL